MNVLQLLPGMEVGGVERGTLEIARYLVLNGHKAVVVSSGGRLVKKLTEAGAKHYSLPIGDKNPFTMYYSYEKLREIIRQEKIDIVHGRSRIPAIAGYFAARAEGKVFITTAHGQYKKHLISRVMGWGKIVIVASEVMAHHMRENFGVPPQKIRVIPRGVDLAEFPYKIPEDRSGKKFRIGMISRFSPIKGHIDFLKAVRHVSRKVPNLEVVLMGDRTNASVEYIKKIELTIRHLMIGNIVKFKGADEDVSKVLGELDVFVSANREQEAFGRSIIEAQARGVPVVATKVGGVLETVEDGVTGLVCEPADPQDMCDKILRYAGDPELRKNIAFAARKSVEERFSLERMCRSEIEAYDKALSGKNILVFKISSLGDIILSVPSLKAVRDKFPLSKIKVMVDVKYRKALENCPYIDEVITCDFAVRDKGTGFLKLAKRLRAEDFEISIDLQNNKKSHLLAFLAGIPERYGYDNGKWSSLLNRKTSLPTKPIKPIEHQARVLALLGIISVGNKLELWPGKENDEWVSAFLGSNWLKKNEKLVGISLSASKKWRTKNWKLEYFAGLAEMLASKKGVRVVLLGSPDDEEEALEFSNISSSKPINAVGKTSISQLMSLIARCSAIVAADSSPIHIAAAMGTPFVAIFGPTDPERHLPPAVNYKVLMKKIKCSPCYKSVCRRGVKCMSSVRPEEVFEEITKIMS